MPRQPRVEFPGAIYQVVTRGEGRRRIFHDQDHYDRLTRGLKDEVTRSGWKVLAFCCWIPNHIHLLLQTPEPNLSRGMQHWLSGYANWYAKRNRRVGHLFQGRYKAFVVEDAGYFWSLSRSMRAITSAFALRLLAATWLRCCVAARQDKGFGRRTG